jgi:hypothetical protein
MMIYVPMSRDVLFGKGTPVQNHVGNKKFRALIADCQKRYEKANNGEKTNLAQEIVDIVIQSTGMFLKPDGEIWFPVENNTARRKVSTAFRTLRMTYNQSKSGNIRSFGRDRTEEIDHDWLTNRHE